MSTNECFCKICAFISSWCSEGVRFKAAQSIHSSDATIIILFGTKS